MGELTKLRGIGPKVEQWLHSVDIDSYEKLKELGAIEAYLLIVERTEFNANIALLYSLVGAIEDRDWQEVARNDKARLRMELEGYAQWNEYYDD